MWSCFYHENTDKATVLLLKNLPGGWGAVGRVRRRPDEEVVKSTREEELRKTSQRSLRRRTALTGWAMEGDRWHQEGSTFCGGSCGRQGHAHAAAQAVPCTGSTCAGGEAERLTSLLSPLVCFLLLFRRITMPTLGYCCELSNTICVKSS